MFNRILQAIGLAKAEKDRPDDDIYKSFEAFKNRPIYRTLTNEIIDKASDNNLLQFVFDNLSTKLPRDYKKHHETVMNWNKSRQAIYWAWCLEGDVTNGGFNQFYFNSTGKYAPFIPDALRLIDAPSFAELVQKANDTYEKANAQITSVQDGSLEGFSKSYEDNPLNDIDHLFYELLKQENLRQKQVVYISNHQSDFIDK